MENLGGDTGLRPAAAFAFLIRGCELPSHEPSCTAPEAGWVDGNAGLDSKMPCRPELESVASLHVRVDVL